MTVMRIIIGALCTAFVASAAGAETCKVHSKSAVPESEITTLDLDLAQPAKLDPRQLPPRTDAIMCRRPSIVPQPDDVRVIIELGVPFGIAEGGPRSLWIFVTAGIVKTRVENGQLTRSETARLNDWLETAQRRFILAVAERG